MPINRNTLFAALPAALTLLFSTIAWGGTLNQPCLSAKNTEQLSLCEQHRASNAAEKLNVETIYGILASSIGTLALLVTIYYSRKATLLAGDAVMSAKGALDHARNTSLRELRPYMVSKSQGTYGTYNEDPSIIEARNFNVEWTNAGKTPAVNVEATANFAILDGNIPEDFLFPNYPYDNFTTGPIGPENSLQANSPWISMSDLESLATNGKHLYLWSWIEYEILEGGPRFRSEACFEVSIPLHISPASDKYSPQYFHRPIFNGLDDGCLRKVGATFKERSSVSGKGLGTAKNGVTLH